MPIWKPWKRNSSRSSRNKSLDRRRTSRRLALESLEDRKVFSATPLGDVLGPQVCEPDYVDVVAESLAVEISLSSQAPQSTHADSVAPVLMVIANQDFWYQDYADTRAALEAQGLDVVVAATTTEVARPHANSGQGDDGGFITPDLAISDVDAEDYAAIVFSGGWGMAQYQYGFEGDYSNSAYQGNAATKLLVNNLISEFLEQDKHVAAVCYGVSVLAYARVDGESLLEGRTVTGWNGQAPSQHDGSQSSREQIESSGAKMLASRSLGDPTTSADDVIVDGNIITAENYDSAYAFGAIVAREVIQAEQEREAEPQPAEPQPADPQPVLMVIANHDFYHREYFETRESLEAAGLEVVVAAATTETATPHAISVIEGREPNVTPDLALSAVRAEDYSSIVFVGGYGAASYQYANESTYDNPIYNGSDEVKQIVNDLINDFVEQDKYLTAICNGVSVLAWARVDGVSPLDGHTVTAWAHTLPNADGGETQWTREQIESNGAMQLLSAAIGDPDTSTDDVFVDGRIITAENYDSAYQFGRTIANRLLEDG